MEKIIKPIKINRSNFATYGDLLSTNDINPMDINAGYAKRFDKDRYVTAQLLGMGKNIGIDYRYVPVGNMFELTPYLIRRLKERMTWD